MSNIINDDNEEEIKNEPFLDPEPIKKIQNKYIIFLCIHSWDYFNSSNFDIYNSNQIRWNLCI